MEETNAQSSSSRRWPLLVAIGAVAVIACGALLMQQFASDDATATTENVEAQPDTPAETPPSTDDANAKTAQEIEQEARDRVAESQPSVEVAAPQPGQTGNASLQLSEECRDSGTVEFEGVTWDIEGLAPLEWQEQLLQDGVITVTTDSSAIFVAEDGTEVDLTFGGVEQECNPWTS